MTKFIHYLNENRTQEITKDEAFDLIAKHCSKNYKLLSSSYNNIHRGIKSLLIDYGYVDSNKGQPRVSINTENYMTLLMDNLPSWNGWPKRSRSIICSTNPDETKSYGSTFKIIPYDNAKIAICPTEDLWYSFKFNSTHKTTLPSFNRLLRNLFDRYNLKVDDTNWNSFKNALNKLDPNSILYDGYYNNTFINYDVINKLFEPDTNLLDHFNKLFNPKKHGFKLDINNLKPNREVWIQGEAILIRE